MALRVASVYRTVSTQAIVVVAGIPKINLLAYERSQLYVRREERDIISREQESRDQLIRKW